MVSSSFLLRFFLVFILHRQIYFRRCVCVCVCACTRRVRHAHGENLCCLCVFNFKIRRSAKHVQLRGLSVSRISPCMFYIIWCIRTIRNYGVHPFFHIWFALDIFNGSFPTPKFIIYMECCLFNQAPFAVLRFQHNSNNNFGIYIRLPLKHSVN